MFEYIAGMAHFTSEDWFDGQEGLDMATHGLHKRRLLGRKAQPSSGLVEEKVRGTSECEVHQASSQRLRVSFCPGDTLLFRSNVPWNLETLIADKIYRASNKVNITVADNQEREPLPNHI